MSVDQPRAIWEFLKQEEQFTAEDLAELRKSVATITNFHNVALYHSIDMRANIETLDSLRLLRASIDRFDTSSAALIETTNKLTLWILRLTVLATVLGAGSIVASGWPYLAWWAEHGFRFH
jgi:hypothetical protein